VVRLDSVRTGSHGPPVLLLHPVGLDGPIWTPLTTQLAKSYRVIAPSLRGHGRSPAFPPPWTVRELAADVHALLQRHADGPVHVVGLSLGGIVAQQLAVDHPTDVGSLVLIATRSGFDEMGRRVLLERARQGQQGGMAAVAEDTMARWFAPTNRHSPIAERVRQRLLADDPRCWAATWRAMAEFGTPDQLVRIQQPALVLGGTGDAGTPPSVSTALAQALPNATLRILPKAGHLAPLEQPQQYADIIDAFLQRCTQP